MSQGESIVQTGRKTVFLFFFYFLGGGGLKLVNAQWSCSTGTRAMSCASV